MAPFRFLVGLLAAAALALTAVAGYAQTARSGGGASEQLLQQIQQLSSDRTSLQADNDKLKKQLDDMRKERDALKSAQQAIDRRVQTSEASLKSTIAQTESTKQELAQNKARTDQLITKFRETVDTLKEVESQRSTTKQILATRDQDLKVCIDRNFAMYKLNEEVLTSLEKQTVWSRVAQAEPFTKIKRVQLENLVDGYKARADDQRITPAAPSAAAPAADTPH
jgi:chromosome segregation ATPase